LKTLLDEHASTKERKLYEAVVALEEGAELTQRALDRVGNEDREALRREAGQMRQHATAIRKLLEERVVSPVH
jgi:hypothetical protein